MAWLTDLFCDIFRGRYRGLSLGLFSGIQNISNAICSAGNLLIETGITRYSAHLRLDAEHPALLLEVVAQLEIFLVTAYTILTRVSS